MNRLQNKDIDKSIMHEHGNDYDIDVLHQLTLNLALVLVLFQQLIQNTELYLIKPLTLQHLVLIPKIKSSEMYSNIQEW